MSIINLTQHTATHSQLNDGVVELHPALQESLKALLTFKTMPSVNDVTERAMRLAALVEGHLAIEASEELIRQTTGNSLELPSFTNILAKARSEVKGIMIAGAPYLMAELERVLRSKSFTPCYSFSERRSIETTGEDGSVSKSSVFLHLGFVGLEEENKFY